MSDDTNHPDNQKATHEGWSDIREKKRGCTDCLLLLLLIAVWVAMTVIGFIVCGVIPSDKLEKGDPYRLVNAIDYNGHVCGSDKAVKHLRYGYYLLDKTVVCVSSCPSTTDYYDYGAYVCKKGYQVTNAMLAAEYVVEYYCMYPLKTKTVLNRCVPDVSNLGGIADGFQSSIANATAAANLVYSTTSGSGGWVGTFLGDTLTLQGVIFGFGIGVSTAVAFAYLYVLRIPGLLFVTIWTIMLSILFFFVVGSILLYTLSAKYKTDGHPMYEVYTMEGFAIGGFVVSFLYLCLLIVMRKRVQLAIGVVKEAARSLASMPFLIIMPIAQVAALCVFLVPWIIYLFYLASSGTITMNTVTTTTAYGPVTYSVRSFVYTKNTKIAFIFMLFCWFWTAEFFTAVGQIIMALSLVAWYFNRDKKTVGNTTVLWALKTTCRYHLGTAAYGSLVIAIIQTIRAVLAYIQYHAKQSKNKVLEYLACCINCCLWCVEKCMKFLNKNAYIQTAIYGYSFCKSARRAFFLILRNILRVAAVNIVADFVLLLGKLFVPVSTTLIAYLVVGYGYPNSEVSGIVAPLVFTFLLAYFVSGMFSEIFSMGIETILCCYIADEEMFPPEQRFAEGSLSSMMADAAKKNNVNQVTAIQVAPAANEKADA